MESGPLGSMMHMIRLWFSRCIDPDMLHHAEVAVRDQMAVEHDIAGEALITRAHDHSCPGLDQDSVEPLAGKARIKRVEAWAGGVGPVFALGIAD